MVDPNTFKTLHKSKKIEAFIIIKVYNKTTKLIYKIVKKTKNTLNY